MAVLGTRHTGTKVSTKNESGALVQPTMQDYCRSLMRGKKFVFAVCENHGFDGIHGTNFGNKVRDSEEFTTERTDKKYWEEKE